MFMRVVNRLTFKWAFSTVRRGRGRRGIFSIFWHAPTCCGRREISHKFGNQNCTVSAPFFAFSRCSFIDSQRLTKKREPPAVPESSGALFKVQCPVFKVQASTLFPLVPGSRLQ